MKTILIVDDELDILEAVRSILEEERYHIVTCGNGREALQCLTETRPDLAIIDIMMPVMNGYETIQAIRQQPAFENLPILVMSAIYPTVQTPRHGWTGFLKKPFSLGALLEHVHKLAPKDPDQEVPE